MFRLICSRALEAIPTLLVLITISFFLMRFAPGSPFSSEKTLPPEVMQNINAKYGLDKPVFEQYITYLGNIIQGDFGPSFKYKDYTVNELISAALPVSAKVGFYAFVLTVILGVTIGTFAALKQNTWVDYWVMSSAKSVPALPVCLFMNPFMTNSSTSYQSEQKRLSKAIRLIRPRKWVPKLPKSSLIRS